MQVFSLLKSKAANSLHPSESNHWYSIDRYGNEHQIKDPFEQSKNYQFRILDLVRKARNLTRSHFPLGHSVAFPDVSNREIGRIVSHNGERNDCLF